MSAKEKTTKNNDISEKIKKEIEKIENKKNRFYFYVMDTKGVPNGSLTYIYETALHLSNMGYSVIMLHSEKDFAGVESWLGEKYASLKHNYIESDTVGVSPADILVIPEIYSSVMYATKKLPCKRIALMQNFGYFTEMTQPGVTWKSYGINDCITTSEILAERVKEVFPSVNTKVVRPSINDSFFNSTDKPKKLIVNFVCKNPSDANSIIKPFFWKYPILKWVCMRNITNLPKAEFADALKESAFTVWVDDKTDFGYSALEAMACGNYVIGKLPETLPEWMIKDGEIRDNGIYFENTKDACDVLFKVIMSYIHKNMPNVINEDAKETLKYYTLDEQRKDIEKIYIGYFLDGRKKELEAALSYANNENE